MAFFSYLCLKHSCTRQFEKNFSLRSFAMFLHMLENCDFIWDYDISDIYRFKEDSDTSPDPEDRGLTDSQEVGDHHLGQVLTKDQQARHHLTPQGIQHLNRSIPRPSITSATRQVISSIVSSQNPFVDW